MDWFGGRVSLGNLDLAGAVNKLSESVKNIERNFDTALFDGDKSDSSSEASGPQVSTTNRKALFDPVMAFMGQQEAEAPAESEGGENISEVRDEESKAETPGQLETAELSSSLFEESRRDDVDSPENSSTGVEHSLQQGSDMPRDHQDFPSIHSSEANSEAIENPEKLESNVNLANVEMIDSAKQLDEEEKVEWGCVEQSETVEVNMEPNQVSNDAVLDESHSIIDASSDYTEEQKTKELSAGDGPQMHPETLADTQGGPETETPQTNDTIIVESESHSETLTNQFPTELPTDRASEVAPVSDTQGTVSATGTDEVQKQDKYIVENREHKVSSSSNDSESVVSVVELEKLKREMKMMEAALQGAARQAQAKADAIGKLMNENEHLKSIVEDLQRKSSEAAEIESLREEYHQRVATLERKVYAVTKERDTLRREQNKKSDAAALLKEKDEIINQIMAEGEELSKKQAAQEATIRKLRAQVRELEEEKKGLLTKLQVEENKVESIKKDKAATERLLQETIEKHQVELSAQKDYYTSALSAAKEAEALAEARANSEARTELESRLRVAGEREEMLVQALEELRQTLSRQEQQAVFREDMLHRDMEDLQRRYQASERRCEELITQVPESTRPLLRQIEAMKDTADRRSEVWAAVERTLNSRFQEAEAKAAAAEERERSVSERLSQTLSRINVLEAQISCLRAEQTQLTRSLEKERQRAAENRQEYLAAKEESDTNEGRLNQLEEELRELKKKHKQELQESLSHREILEQELEREKATRLELERKSRVQSSDQIQITKQKSAAENGKLAYKLSTANSTGSMEESFFLQASLDSSDKFSERRNSGEPPMSSYYFKNMTPSALEAALRQKEGELSSYMSHLTTMESVRDSLAEELVKMTEQCEKWRTEATMIPVIRAELEALRRRHAAVLELIGEVMKRQFWWAWFVIGSWLKQEEMMQLAEPECVGSSLPLIHWLLNEVSTIPALKQMSGNFWKEEVTKSWWPSNPKLSLRCALGQIRWLSFGANHGDVGRKKEYRW